MPTKRYKAYFSQIDFIFDPDSADETKEYVILTHSCGLLKALIFCTLHKIMPKRIVSMDCPNLNRDAMMERMKTMDENLKMLYINFLKFVPNISDYPIVSLRRENDSVSSDHVLFQKNLLYSEPTHYPYEHKLIRDQIVTLLQKET